MMMDGVVVFDSDDDDSDGTMEADLKCLGADSEAVMDMWNHWIWHCQPYMTHTNKCVDYTLPFVLNLC
jgi:hypothetical protein